MVVMEEEEKKVVVVVEKEAVAAMTGCLIYVCRFGIYQRLEKLTAAWQVIKFLIMLVCFCRLCSSLKDYISASTLQHFHLSMYCKQTQAHTRTQTCTHTNTHLHTHTSTHTQALTHTNTHTKHKHLHT